jgi:hypothetical protein
MLRDIVEEYRSGKLYFYSRQCIDLLSSGRLCEQVRAGVGPAHSSLVTAAKKRKRFAAGT